MSYSEMRADGVARIPAIAAAGTERVAFLQKVYMLTFVGICFFAGGIALPILGAGLGNELCASYLNLAFGLHPVLAFLIILGTSWLAHSVSMTKGLNVVAFFGLSALWSFLSLPLVAIAIATTGVGVVFQAAALTTIVFGGLTAYVLISRKDFSFMGAALSMGFFLLIGAVVVLMVGNYVFNADMNILSLGISIFAVILFSGYVLYDTSNILHHYATDMVVPAAMALMVDFIILFRNILFLLMRRD